MPERAHPNDPIWQSRFFLFPTKALAYLRRRYRFCRPFVKNKRVLDVPCGTGMGSPFLRSASELIGLDRDSNAVDFAKNHYKGIYTNVLQGTMVELPFSPNFFDTVVCLEGLEHLSYTNGVLLLSEAARVLKQDGFLLLSCPLSINGSHSGNEFHLYEWAEAELISTIERLFRIIKCKRIQGPGGPVLLLAAKLEQKTEVSMMSKHILYENDNRYKTAIRRVSNWVNKNWIDCQSRYTVHGEPGFFSTCFAVLAEETLGTLSKWNSDRRQKVVDEINAQQDQDSGAFGLELVKVAELFRGSLCEIRYVRYQLTYFALSALSALGACPRYPLKFAERFLNREYALGWAEAGPWHDPWNHSNRIMFLLRFLIYLADNEGQDKAWEVYDVIVDDLLKRQDTNTGLWHGLGECSARHAVYAAYHFFPFIFWRGILPPFAERIIDSVLSIQHADGLFGDLPGGGACEDLDAIDTLVKFSLFSNHRSGDVKSALIRAFDRILQLQRPDGGFPNYLDNRSKSFKRRVGEHLLLDKILNRPYRPQKVYYSGWCAVGAAKGESDMWAAWFRPLALCLIVSRYPELGALPNGMRFHSFPCLGWHDVDCIRACTRSKVSNKTGYNHGHIS